VTWDSPTDPSNPLNWPRVRKWSILLITSLGGLVTLMSGAMLAPALKSIGADLHMESAETEVALSIFVLAFAPGPLVLGPCSEVFGRRWVWVLSGSWYILWNTVCGFANTKGLMIAGRFLAGLGASAEFALSTPISSDCFRPEERGMSMAIKQFIPLLGPAIGPIIGGVITDSINWRWLFWVLSIFDIFVVFTVFIFFPETHHPTILARKAASLRKTTGLKYYSATEIGSPTLAQRLKVGLSRPFRLLVTQPILQLMSVFLAYNFGILYIMLSTFATLWIDHYHQSTGTSGLHYIAIAIGYSIAVIIGGPAQDRLWKHFTKKNAGATAPEYRVPLILPGVLLIPIGLFWYGWSAEKHLHWAMVDVGAGILGCGYILSGVAAQSYIVEAFLQYNASAAAASQVLRNIFAFAFPIFSPRMYQVLGYGWGNSLLAFLFLAIGVPAPIILWRYGARLRERGKPQR
ncbi:MFS multidrug transporter, partial [Lophium mytilinum]